MKNTNSWTLITGAARGLGAQLCKALAAEGHHLLIHYNHSYNDALVIQNTCLEYGVNAELIQGDFSSEDSMEIFLRDLLKYFSDIKYLVNSVGPYLIESGYHTPDKEWKAIFQTNLHAPVALLRALMPYVLKKLWRYGVWPVFRRNMILDGQTP